MLKASPDVRLMTAAVSAHDELRTKAIPALHNLAERIEDAAAHDLIWRVRSLVVQHIDGLRASLKDRQPAPRPSRNEPWDGLVRK
jgi:hypothetical protein